MERRAIARGEKHSGKWSPFFVSDLKMSIFLSFVIVLCFMNSSCQSKTKKKNKKERKIDNIKIFCKQQQQHAQ